jgi:hypothetical protein
LRLEYDLRSRGPCTTLSGQDLGSNTACCVGRHLPNIAPVDIPANARDENYRKTRSRRDDCLFTGEMQPSREENSPRSPSRPYQVGGTRGRIRNVFSFPRNAELKISPNSADAESIETSELALNLDSNPASSQAKLPYELTTQGGMNQRSNLPPRNARPKSL